MLNKRFKSMIHTTIPCIKIKNKHTLEVLIGQNCVLKS